MSIVLTVNTARPKNKHRYMSREEIDKCHSIKKDKTKKKSMKLVTKTALKLNLS